MNFITMLSNFTYGYLHLLSGLYVKKSTTALQDALLNNDVVELPHSLQDRIATCISLTLTLTVKLTRTLNLTLQLTLILAHLDPNCSLTMHKSNNKKIPREAER